MLDAEEMIELKKLMEIVRVDDEYLGIHYLTRESNLRARASNVQVDELENNFYGKNI